MSAHSDHRREAIDYAISLCSADFQRGTYVRSGGQPGSLAAWTDAEVNAATRNFFADTLDTLKNSYLRPTYPGFIAFFRECAHDAARAIAGDLPAAEFARLLDRRFAGTLPQAVLDRVGP